MVRPPAGNQADSTSRTAPASTSGGGDRTVPGPDAIAGAALTTQALARTRVNPDAVAQVIKEGKDVTYDMKADRNDPTAVGTMEMAKAIAKAMGA